MKILIIDGQGGGIGKAIIEGLLKNVKDIEIVAVGTNAIATSSMLKAGAKIVATGENSVVYNSKYADIIIGPIGICFGNSLYGEVSPKMAKAVSSSDSKKILIPIAKSNIHIVGVEDKLLDLYIDEVVEKVIELQNNEIT